MPFSEFVVPPSGGEPLGRLKAELRTSPEQSDFILGLLLLSRPASLPIAPTTIHAAALRGPGLPVRPFLPHLLRPRLHRAGPGRHSERPGNHRSADGPDFRGVLAG